MRPRKNLLLLLILFILPACSENSGAGGSRYIKLRAVQDTADLNILEFSKDGNYCATAGLDTDITIWDPQTGEKISHIANAHSERVLKTAFHKKLYTASFDSAKAWDPETGKELMKFGAGGEMTEQEFYGVYLQNGEAKSGTILSRGHTGTVDFIDSIADEAYLVTVSRDTTAKVNMLQVWTMADGSLFRELEGFENVALSPDGKLVAVNFSEHLQGRNYRHHFKFMTVPGLKEHKSFDEGSVLDFSRDGSLFVYYIYNTETRQYTYFVSDVSGKEIARFTWNFFGQLVRFSPAHDYVLLSEGFLVICVDLKTGEIKWQEEMKTRDAGMNLQVTPDGKYAVFEDRTWSRIRFVRLDTGEEWTRIEYDSIFTGFAVSPDGKTLVTGIFEGKLGFWNIKG